MGIILNKFVSTYTVYNLASDVQKKIHGGTINNLQSSLDEGRRNMIGNIKPPEMIRSAYLEDAVYDKVNRYALPSDLKYDNIIEIKKLSSYKNVDTLEHPLEVVYRRHFDQKSRNAANVFAISNENGVKYGMLSRPKGLKECQNRLLNAANSLSANGTWNVGGNVENLKLDRLNHITKNASLKFDINNSSTTGFINNFSMTPVDILEFLNTGAAFDWVNIPLPKQMISVEIILGSNQTNLTTDYYHATVTSPHDNNVFITNWNLLKWMLNNLSSVGNPNPKSIGYIQLNFTTTGVAIPNCNIDAFVVRKGVVYNVLYNSQFCLIDSVTGAWKQFTTSNSDIITAEEDTYEILMLETALVEQEYLYANNFGAQTDVTMIQSKLFDKYSQYKLNHTDEAISPEEWSYVGGDIYQGYTSDALDNFANSDGDNSEGITQNVDQNNNFCC